MSFSVLRISGVSQIDTKIIKNSEIKIFQKGLFRRNPYSSTNRRNAKQDFMILQYDFVDFKPWVLRLFGVRPSRFLIKY